MKAPRILVSAGRLQKGGGLSVLRGLVEEVFPQLPAEFIVVCRKDVASALNGSRKNVTLLPENPAVGSLLRGSALREQIAIRKLVGKHHCNLLLVIGSAALLFPPCPQVLVVLNRLYLSAKYRQRVAGASRLRSLLISAKGLFLRYSSRHCKLLMTESEAMRSLVCRKWGVPPNRIEVLHKGISAAVIVRAARQAELGDIPPVILCVSHFAMHKGFETLIASAVNLLKTGAKFSLWVAGDFDESGWRDSTLVKAKKRFDALLEQSGASERFRFLGSLSPAQLANAYRQADLCVFPSWCESYPNPLPEALANGIPIVAADTDVNRELAGDAALYFLPEDPVDLADRIRLLVTSPRTRCALSARGLERAREFSWRRTADDLCRVLKHEREENLAPTSISICHDLQGTFSRE
jgi:glycosyltransferase involved in cell wall biosynthesis